jgi:hypothetical protein
MPRSKSIGGKIKNIRTEKGDFTAFNNQNLNETMTYRQKIINLNLIYDCY